MGKRTPPVISLRSPDSPFCRCATSSPDRGKSFLSGGAFCICRFAPTKLPLRGSWQSRQALTERVGSLPEGAGAAQAASEGAHACQHNIYPNLSNPAPGKTAPPGQGKEDSVDCRRTLFQNIPKLQQIPLVFILFDEIASRSLAIITIDKTVTCRI